MKGEKTLVSVHPKLDPLETDSIRHQRAARLGHVRRISVANPPTSYMLDLPLYCTRIPYSTCKPSLYKEPNTL